jgi:hypothetical protein
MPAPTAQPRAAASWSAVPHIDPDHLPIRREPQLPLAGKQHAPRLMLLPSDLGVLTVETEAIVRSWLAWDAG